MWGKKTFPCLPMGDVAAASSLREPIGPVTHLPQSHKHQSASVQLARVSVVRSAGPAAMSRKQAPDGGCSDSAREGSEPVLWLCSSTPRNRVCSGREARENTLACCALTLIKKMQKCHTSAAQQLHLDSLKHFWGFCSIVTVGKKRLLYVSQINTAIPGAQSGGKCPVPLRTWPQKLSRHALKGVVWHNHVQHFRGQRWPGSAVALGRRGAS